ncbi:hypothetical protein BS50DRAFT_584556 [Corynespora cassiicola Philippines]|uniref:Metallothionein-I transcription activator n=1 Tax=Corynespora cassiicola Philippines TaxID=1448308 RepID=A0A2T2P0W9_CORCC|nr:hypothetical protein BS50DRAFT_584556 [Corynespora cassiicola Philippines]
MPPLTRRASRIAVDSPPSPDTPSAAMPPTPRTRGAAAVPNPDTDAEMQDSATPSAEDSGIFVPEYYNAPPASSGHPHEAEIIAALHRADDDDDDDDGPSALTVEAFNSSSEEYSGEDAGSESEGTCTGDASAHGTDADNDNDTDTDTEARSRTSGIRASAPVTAPVYPSALTSTAMAAVGSTSRGSALMTPPAVPARAGNDNPVVPQRKVVRYKCAGFREDGLVDEENGLLIQACDEYVEVAVGSRDQSALRCKACGCRVLYKLRTGRMVQFQTA